MRPRRLLAALVPLGVAALSTLSACATTANISDIYMALDGNGDRKRDSFFTDSQEIHCIAEGGFGRKDVTVEGYIRQVRAYDPADKDFVPVDTYFGYVEFSPQPSQGRPQKLDITLIAVNEKGEPDDKAPRAAGSYVCEIYLDGKLARSIDFNVAFAECPAVQIIPGAPCVGFYEVGKDCRQFGDKSSEKRECTCKDAGWECR